MFRPLFSYFLVRSLCLRLLSFFGSVFLFCTFESLQFLCPVSFFDTVQPFPVLVFPNSFWPPLGLLCCLCFSAVLRFSRPPPVFFFPLLWGLVSVRWLAAAPTVSVITPLLFRPLWLLHSSTPAPIILSPFPLTAFLVAPSSLPLLFSWAAAPVTPSRFPPSMSPLPRPLLEVFFSPALVPPQLVYRSSLSVPTAFCGGSDSFGSQIPFVTWSLL